MGDINIVITMIEESKIVNYEISPKSYYRYRLYFENGRCMDIGDRNTVCYIDNGDKGEREDFYEALTIKEWTKLHDRKPCRFFFECLLLNGKYKTMVENINMYNRSL
jgi:hypothetical protein